MKAIGGAIGASFVATGFVMSILYASGFIAVETNEFSLQRSC